MFGNECGWRGGQRGRKKLARRYNCTNVCTRERVTWISNALAKCKEALKRLRLHTLHIHITP